MTALKLYLETLDSKVNEVFLKVTTLLEIAELFEKSEYALAAIVIQDYLQPTISFLNDISSMISEKKLESSHLSSIQAGLSSQSSSDDYSDNSDKEVLS
jgi:hypothetical protein